MFGFVQLEFGFLLGPPDGRYLVRPEPEGELEAVLVLRTLGAPQRRRLRGRRGRAVERAEPEPVATSRATVVRPAPFGSAGEAEAWLDGIRRDREARETALGAALSVLDRALHAHRLAAADPSLPAASLERALCVRAGYGVGDEVAEGRFRSAWQLPTRGARTKRSMEAPEERFAALLAGRDRAAPAEELVLRARADLDAARLREAALQARVALESLLAEPAGGPSAGRDELDAQRESVGAAANAALGGELPAELGRALREAVERMEAELRRRRLRGG